MASDNKLLFCFCLMTMFSLASSTNFTDLFQAYWSADHITEDENEPMAMKLSLDNSSGCGFGSKKKYLFGQASLQIKLVPGDSAGVVTAFYMSSDGSNHNELDFEFLGNVSGEPYIVQTNIYINGTGDREQRHSLWFDPTADFHTYSMLWNRQMIRFLIDGIPIRVLGNSETKGISYPKNQAVGVYGSIWNADDWATQGGLVKTNWSHAPFVSTFRSFAIDACEFAPEDDVATGKCSISRAYWWDAPKMNGLSPHERRQLKWVRSKHLVYDYCKDSARFTQLPKECLA